MPSSPFLAADWGTSNLRAWRIGADGEVEKQDRFPWGVARLKPGEPAQRLAEDIRPALDARDLPAVTCGMIGSTLGIAEVPYLACPAGLEEVAAALHRVDEISPPLSIAPGLEGRRLDGEPDVMRGEETKVLGWVSLDPARAHGRRLLCLPGTHTKWIIVEDGRIVRFVTCMSGEVFDVMSHHGVLRSDDGPNQRDAFAEGLVRGAETGALAAKLFTVRSRVVTGAMDRGWTRDFLSGLLIGNEVASLPDLVGAGGARQVELLGDASLCRLYEAALALRGMATQVHDGDAAVLAGLKALFAQGAAE